MGAIRGQDFTQSSDMTRSWLKEPTEQNIARVQINSESWEGGVLPEIDCCYPAGVNPATPKLSQQASSEPEGDHREVVSEAGCSEFAGRV